MKKLLFYLCFFILVFTSCDSAKQKNSADDLKNQCELKLKESLKDPSSYQKISIEIIDSVKKSQSLIENFDLLYGQTSIELGLTTQEISDSIRNIIKDLRMHPSKDSVSYIVVECKYRAKNSYGALDLSSTTFHYLMNIPPSGNRYFIYK